MATYSKAQKKLIKLALQDILASTGFVNSSQLSNFLTFIVNKTLDEKADEIKGYTIGVDALGRPEDFDPQIDPSVRVMAGRLRQALENYTRETGGFSLEGENAKIQLIKGSYIPRIELSKTLCKTGFQDKLAALEDTDIDIGFEVHHFQKKLSEKKPKTASWILITACSFGLLIAGLIGYHYYSEHSKIEPTVLPEKQIISIEDASLPTLTLHINADQDDLPDWVSAKKIQSTAVVSFSRFNEYRVFNISGVENSKFLKRISSDYHLSMFFSKAPNNETLEAFLTLTRPPTNEIIWSDKLFFPQSEGEQTAINLEKIENVTSEVMSPYGIIHGDITSNKFPPPRLDCIRAVYSYFAKEDLQAYANGLDCARRATSRPNASSSMYSMLTFMYVEAYRKQIIEVSNSPLNDAQEYAEKAITLDPGNARAFQALFAVEKTRGNQEAAIYAAAKAMSLNPYDRDIIGDYAAYLVSINEQEKAKPVLEKALKLTPVLPSWLAFYAYLHADVTGNFKTADRLSEKFQAEDSPLLAVAIILSADRQNDTRRAHAAANTLNITEPDFATNPRSALIRRGFDITFATRIAERLESAKHNWELIENSN